MNEGKYATKEAIQKYVDQSFQAEQSVHTTHLVVTIALILDVDPLKVQSCWMDANNYARHGFNRIVSGQAAKERLEENMKVEKPTSEDN